MMSTPFFMGGSLSQIDAWGMHAFYRVDPVPETDAEHLWAWQACVDYCERMHGAAFRSRIDLKAKNAERLCFCSHDPAAAETYRADAPPIRWDRESALRRDEELAAEQKARARKVQAMTPRQFRSKANGGASGIPDDLLDQRALMNWSEGHGRWITMFAAASDWWQNWTCYYAHKDLTEGEMLDALVAWASTNGAIEKYPRDMIERRIIGDVVKRYPRGAYSPLGNGGGHEKATWRTPGAPDGLIGRGGGYGVGRHTCRHWRAYGGGRCGRRRHGRGR